MVKFEIAALFLPTTVRPAVYTQWSITKTGLNFRKRSSSRTGISKRQLLDGFSCGRKTFWKRIFPKRWCDDNHSSNTNPKWPVIVVFSTSSGVVWTKTISEVFPGTYTKHGPGSMDHPMDHPQFSKGNRPCNMKIYWRSGYEKHRLIFIAYVLEGLSRNSGLLWIEGAGSSYVIRQLTSCKVMLRLIRKLNTLRAPPLKLQAIH